MTTGDTSCGSRAKETSAVAITSRRLAILRQQQYDREVALMVFADANGLRPAITEV